MQKMFLFLALTLCAWGLRASYVETVNGIEWRYDVVNGKATVGTRIGAGAYSPAVSRELLGVVTIPSSLGGYPVTAIGNYAFSNCSKITSIVVPEGVKEIGGAAFSGSGIESITIPVTIAKIGDRAFDNCTQLTSVYISDLKAWCEIAFGNASANPIYYAQKLYLNKVLIRDLVIPQGVVTIEFATFFNCKALKSVVIPSSVTSINKSAFNSCSGLTSVTIPQSVTSIGDYAFEDCTGLMSIVSSSVTTIGDYAFQNCTALTSVSIPSSVTTIGYNAFYNVAPVELTTPMWPSGMLEDNLKTLKIPEGTITISTSAFASRTSLTSVTIPSSVTSIDDYAFYECSGLTSITIPSSVRAIGGYAFYGCTGLTSVIIPSGVTSIGYAAFYDVAPKKLTAAWLPSGMSKTSVTTLIIPEGVTVIGSQAFYGCTGLTSVTIPESVTSISKEAFYGCTKLPTDEQGIQYESDEKTLLIKAPTFLEGRLRLPKTVKFIHSNAFEDCHLLTSITLPSGVLEIGVAAFSDCKALTSVTIPESVVSIRSSAFEYCTAMTSVTLPSNLKVIDIKTFYECTKLAEIVVPESVISIGENAFYNCKGVQKVVLPADIDSIGSGAFYNVAPTTLIASWLPSGMSKTSVQDIVVPTGITAIKTMAFYDCSGVTSVILPESLLEIGESAFEFCSALSEIVIPAKVDAIADYAFEACDDLMSVTFQGCPPSLVSDYAFPSTKGYYNSVYADFWHDVLNAAGIWKNLTMEAYVGTPEVEVEFVEVTFDANGGEGGVTLTLEVGTDLVVPSVTRTGYTFVGWEPQVSTIVPKQDVTYVAKWQQNTPTDEDEADVAYALSVLRYQITNGCVSITGLSDAVIGKLVIPSMIEGCPVTEISSYSFAHCEGLNEIHIPATVTVIGRYAFDDCRSLSTIHVDAANPSYRDLNGLLLTKDGERILLCSRGLTEVTIPQSVKQIDSGAFEYCVKLTSVTIPKSVTQMGPWAFEDCTGLERVLFEGEPPTSGGSGFYSSFYGVTAPGYYLSKYATSWQRVLDANGKWDNLTMSLIDEVTVTIVGEGSVMGTGAYMAGSEVTLVATANAGSLFCGWSTSPVTISTTYSFTMPTESINLMAYFAPIVAVENYVSGYGLFTPKKVEEAIAEYIAVNQLISKEAAKQELLETDEVFTEDEMKELALGAPVIKIKNGVATVSVQVQKASSLNGEWEDAATIEAEITPKADEKAAFYKFVVPNEQ